MKFGMDKRGVLSMKRGNEVECNGIELEDGEEICQIGEERYKYLGVLEKGDICPGGMKENIRKEYFKRFESNIEIKIKSKACIPSDKHIGGANCSIYSAGIIEWTKEDVKEMDKKKRKIITIYGGLYPRSNVERF